MTTDAKGLVRGLRDGILLGIGGLIIGSVAQQALLTATITGVEIGAAMFALGLLEGLMS